MFRSLGGGGPVDGHALRAGVQIVSVHVAIRARPHIVFAERLISIVFRESSSGDKSG